MVMTLLEAITDYEALAAEDARYRAQTNSDFAVMERLFGDDLIYQHSTGMLDDKAGFIHAMSSEMVKYRHMERHDVIVRTYGAIAIITGRARFEVTVDRIDSIVNIRFHSVWVKRGANPQFVSWQATPLP
jgi:hypothetical protein